MVVRRKKAKPRARVTFWKPWGEIYAKAFGGADDWTPPDQVKISRGLKGGTMTAVFTDAKGLKIEGFIRFRARGNEWDVTNRGFRISVGGRLSQVGAK